jgi:hypothetical protein
MQSIFNFLLKSISVVFWAIFIYLMFSLAVNMVVLIANFDVLLSNFKSNSTAAILGTALSPGFTGFFVYLIAYFTWKWGSRSNSDLSLFEKWKRL